MISVIVPVYNAENCLHVCVESLMQQSYKDIEIILVNDCSTDDSLAVCQEYAEKDSRIKIINKETNEGPGKARELGVNIAEGEWLCFVDSDDYIELDTFQKLNCILKPEVDVAVFGLFMCYEDEKGNILTKESIYPEKRIAKTPNEIADLLVYLDTHRTFPYMCNKIYRTGFVKNSNVEFNGLKIMEDFFYNIELFSKARCITTLDESFYNYRRPVKETLATTYRSYFFELSKKRYLAEEEFLEKMSARSKNNLQLIAESYVKHLIACLIRDASKNAHLTFKKRWDNAKEYLSDEITTRALGMYLPPSIKMKALVWLFKTKKSLVSTMIGKIGCVVQNEFRLLYRKLVK